MEDQPKLLLRCIQRMNAMIAMLLRQINPYSRYGMIFLRVFCRFMLQVSNLRSTDGVVTATNIGRRALLVVRTCRRGLRTGPILHDWTLPLCGTAGNILHDQGLCSDRCLCLRIKLVLANQTCACESDLCLRIRLVLSIHAHVPDAGLCIRNMSKHPSHTATVFCP